MDTMDFTAWRCANDTKFFCPEEGCPKHYGCARDHGWKMGDPSPREVQGYQPETSEVEKWEPGP